MPEFKVWRDQVCLLELDNIEDMKMNALALSEADIKAVILYELKIKTLFKKCFDVAKDSEELEKEEK